MADLPPIADALRSGMEERMAAERLSIAEERLRLKDAIREAEERTAPPKPSMFAEWLKPGPILVIAGFLGAQFVAYQNDRATLTGTINDVRNTAISRFQEQGTAITGLANELKSSVKAADDRSTKYVPMIESIRAASDAQKLINDQVSDRINSMVIAIQELRKTVDALRDLEQKNREDILVDKAKREGRLMPGHTVRDPTPEEMAKAQPGR